MKYTKEEYIKAYRYFGYKEHWAEVLFERDKAGGIYPDSLVWNMKLNEKKECLR